MPIKKVLKKIRTITFNQNFYLIQGEIILTIHATYRSYNSCVVQYLTYKSINVLNINQFHSKTSELLIENKTLANTLT